MTCADEPARPEVRTADLTRNAKNAANYIYELRSAGRDCRCKLDSVASILNKKEPQQCTEG